MNEVTVGQAAKIVGVPVDILRSLCDDGVIAAAVRRKGGHWYLPLDAIPDRASVRQRLLEQYRSELAAAQTAGRKAQAEVEAVQLDLAQAADDVEARQVLGNDISAAADNNGALAYALIELRRAALWVTLLHRQLRLLEEHSGPAL